MIKIITFIIIISPNLFARDPGKTEITADEGIEVFQNEKYYLLKKNVNISSDEFNLSAEKVKAYFNKDLYDIVILDAHSNVNFEFNNGAKGEGNHLNFLIEEKKLTINGKNSYINFNDLVMNSDNTLMIDNSKKQFFLSGPNSKLRTENLEIIADSIKGQYKIINNINEIINLVVIDKELVSISEDQMDMYAKKAIFSKEENLIELFDDVKIIRNNETIIGDYAKINTLNKSYKIISKNSKRVKLLIENSDEQN